MDFSGNNWRLESWPPKIKVQGTASVALSRTLLSNATNIQKKPCNLPKIPTGIVFL